MNPFHRLHSLRMKNDEAGYSMQEMRGRFERIGLRHENGTAPHAVVAHQLFQTPNTLATQLAKMLKLKPGERILEPSAGLGRLIEAVLPYEPSEIVAIDVSMACVRELVQRKWAGVKILEQDFLLTERQQIGTFDAIIMNPPFTHGSDIKHVFHAMKFLNPGGRVASICLSGERREREFKHMATEWFDFNSGAFKESNTNVPTSMFVIHE